ncbi:hypothetical protein JST56_07265 [Candidatus Dependentiae bacterium]|nr:hypothetical protein [Candidatus Dependentiae bacterium]
MSTLDVDKLIPEPAKEDLKEVVALLGVARDTVIELAKESRNIRFGGSSDGTTLATAVKQIDTYQQKQDELTVSLKEYQKLQDQLVITQAKLNASESEAAKNLATLKISQQERNAQLKQQAELEKAASNSIDEARARVKQMTTERNALNLATTEGKARQNELNAEIDRYNAFIKENVDKYQQQKINIGNYSGALTILEQELQRVRQAIDQNNNSGEQHTTTIIQLQKEEALLTQLVENQAAGFASATGELRNNQNALMAMQAAGLENTETFRLLLAETAELKDRVGDLRAEVKHLSSDTHTLDGLVGTVQLLAGSFAIGTATAELFGQNNEDLQKSMQKLQAVMTLVVGVQQIANALQKESSTMLFLNEIRTKAVAAAQWLWNYATQATTASMTALRGILISTGLGAILVLISSTAAAMAKWGEETDKETEKLQALNEQLKLQKQYQDDLIEGYKQQSDEIIAQMEAEGATSSAIRKQKEEDAKAVVELQKESLDKANANLENYEAIKKKLSKDGEKPSEEQAKAYNDAVEIQKQASKSLSDAQHAQVMLHYQDIKEEKDEEKKAADDAKKLLEKRQKDYQDYLQKLRDLRAAFKNDTKPDIEKDDYVAQQKAELEKLVKVYDEAFKKVGATMDDHNTGVVEGAKTVTENETEELSNRLQIQIDFAKKQEEIDKEVAEKKKKYLEEEKELWKKAGDQAIDTGAAIAKSIYDQQIQAQDDLLASLDAEKQKKIDLVNTEVISQDEKTRKIAQINLDYAQQQEAIEARKRELQRREAQFEKAASIASIIAKTAEAVVSALKIPIYGEALAIAHGAIGALQLAKVVATPLPAYANETPVGGHPADGPALVGEGGKPEVVTTKNGSFIADRPMIVDLEKGDTVKHLDRYTDAMLIPLLKTRNKSDDLQISFQKHTDQMMSGLKNVAKAIERKPVPSLHIVGGQWSNYINSKL